MIANGRLQLFVGALAILVGCSRNDGHPSDAIDAQQGDPGVIGPGDSTQTPSDAPTDQDHDGLAGDPMVGPALHEVRGVLHMHSAYSHDGCDNNPQPDGVPNTECINDLREAICANDFDFLYMTDHPHLMQDFGFPEVLYYDAGRGDELVMQEGLPIANRLKCAGTGQRVLVQAGFESDHTAPLGMHHHLEHATSYGALNDARPLEECQATVTDIKNAGAVVAVVHSEEPDLSAQRLLDSGVEAMEWYNVHASLLALTGGSDTLSGDPLQALDKIRIIDDFLLGSDSGAHPDLVVLALFNLAMPEAGFEKWRTVNQTRLVTGLLGSDIHRNGSVEPVCSGSALLACEAAAVLYPNALTVLISGGQLMLSDNVRLDSYARLQRMLENRLLVTALTPDGLAEAIRLGRGYSVFTLFGEPQGFKFEGSHGTTLLPLGSVSQGPVRLHVQAPTAPGLVRGAPFTPTEALTAEIRMVLKRIDAQGTTDVATVTTLGGTLDQNVTAPGAYYVELWIRPYHLENALGDARELADVDYRWLLTNPIRVTP